jgi:hypothetical protein
MNEEGRPALGRGEAKRLPSTGFLELYVYVYVHAPCLYLLSPSRPVIVYWHWTRPHASFGFRFTSCTGPLDVVISFELSLPCSSARRMSSLLGTTCQLYPPTRTPTHTPPSEFISFPQKGILATRSVSPCRDYSPCPFPILAYTLALNVSGTR